MSRILHFAHQTLIQALPQGAIVVDATVGNGLDTAFLLRHDSVKHIFAFDVQEDALNVAKTLNPLSIRHSIYSIVKSAWDF
jgi:16S rRNA C1402 N4-methylase RsmH